MQRGAVHTKIAVLADAGNVAELWSELRRIGARSERAVNPLTVADATQRFAEVIGRPDADVLLACEGPRLAGLAVVRIVQPDPLSPTRVLQLSNLVVSASHRRRGVGHALIAAAADYADQRGVDHVAAGVYPSLRDANRFFARLGFAPITVERIAPVTALQRRVGVVPNLTIDERVRRRLTRSPVTRPRRPRTTSRLPD